MHIIRFLFYILIVLLFQNCGNPPIIGKNIVGTWFHERSKIMGGFSITAKTELTIVRNGEGDYSYNLHTIIIDQMYGGNAKTSFSNGNLEKEVSEKKWHFIGGDFGNRGAYIAVPTDNFKNGKPKTLTIHFASGRGTSMIFTY